MYWLPKVMVNTKVKWWGITKAQINRSKRCPKRRNQRRPVFSVCERPARKVPQQKQATEWVTGLEFFRKWQQGAKLTRTLESKSNSIQWNHRVRTSTAPDLQRVGTRVELLLRGAGGARVRDAQCRWRGARKGVRRRPPRLTGVNVLPSRLEEADTARLRAPRGTRSRPLPNNLPCRKSRRSQAPGTQGSAIQDNCSANKVPREWRVLAIQTH